MSTKRTEDGGKSAGLSIRSLDQPLFIVFGHNSEGTIVTS